jgi:hypothetical protein
MNMVAVLGVPLMVAYDATVVQSVREGAGYVWNAAKSAWAAGTNLIYELPEAFQVKSHDGLWWGAALISLVLILWAVWQSKRPAPEFKQMDEAAERGSEKATARP